MHCNGMNMYVYITLATRVEFVTLSIVNIIRVSGASSCRNFWHDRAYNVYPFNIVLVFLMNSHAAQLYAPKQLKRADWNNRQVLTFIYYCRCCPPHGPTSSSASHQLLLLLLSSEWKCKHATSPVRVANPPMPSPNTTWSGSWILCIGWPHVPFRLWQPVNTRSTQPYKCRC